MVGGTGTYVYDSPLRPIPVAQLLLGLTRCFGPFGTSYVERYWVPSRA